MISKEILIKNRLGIHARPAALFVQEAQRYKSKVVVSKDGLEVNGKSVMGLLLLAAEKGARILLRAEGPDEADALRALERLIEGGFGEAG